MITYRAHADAARDVVTSAEAAGRRAVALPLDTAVVGSFGAFADALGRALDATWGRTTFDYLVNNAGTGLHKSVLETTEAEFDTLVNEHLKGVFFLTQKLLPRMADGGRIVNVSSGLARVAMPNTAAYAMVKGGIEVFTRVLAKEVGARGITVNTVAPGAIATDFRGGALRENPEAQRMVAQLTALGRHGVAADVGPVIAALLSDDNHWVNGQRIEASGGMAV